MKDRDLKVRIFPAWLSLAVLTGCSSYGVPVQDNTISAINTPIVFPSEPHQKPDLENVNGPIVAGEGADLGDLRNVNGAVSARGCLDVGDIVSTNGSITVERGCTVSGSIVSANGQVHLRSESIAKGSIRTSNGDIEVSHSRVVQDVETTNGDISLENARVSGNVVVAEKGLWDWIGWNFSPPTVTIGINSVVEGGVIARRRARVFIHSSAKVGAVTGAEPIVYSGNRP